jgi:hypothetical protein
MDFADWVALIQKPKVWNIPKYEHYVGGQKVWISECFGLQIFRLGMLSLYPNLQTEKYKV